MLPNFEEDCFDLLRDQFLLQHISSKTLESYVQNLCMKLNTDFVVAVFCKIISDCIKDI